MKTRHWKRHWAIRIGEVLLLLAGVAGMVVPADARDWRHESRYHRHRPALRVHRRYHPVRAGPHRYGYRTGRFYRHHHRKYVAVRAPIGAVVAHLAPGFQIMVSGGNRCFCYANTYYRRHPRGYCVVPRPVRVYRPEPRGMGVDIGSPASRELPDRAWITVTVEVLNVRAGPGRSHPVIGQVRQGRRLEVKGNAPGWSYVRLPHGRYGWVMNRFTTAISRDPKG